MEVVGILVLVVILVFALGAGLARLVYGSMPHESFCSCEPCLKRVDELEARVQTYNRRRAERRYVRKTEEDA